AQAAMIGNPVSMPRVIHLVERYNQTAGRAAGVFRGRDRAGRSWTGSWPPTATATSPAPTAARPWPG
ncbi:MAG: hypothetical protein MZV70_45945, partial [Desulfobacterales bacterium]|nr:hypothetical protein [Desulfobacterales bacterium]